MKASFFYFLVFISLFFVQCYKKEDNYKAPNPDPVILVPQFEIPDTIIMLSDNDTSYILKISGPDSLSYFYTLNGNKPDLNSTKYNASTGITLYEGQTTVQVVAFYKNYSSEIKIKTFIVGHLLPVTISGIKNNTEYSQKVNIAISNLNAKYNYDCILNSGHVDLSNNFTVSDPGFYSLKIKTSVGSYNRTDSFQFVILDPLMFESEWGLSSWVPAPFKEDVLSSENIECMYPKHFLEGLNLPVIMKVLENSQIKPLYLKVNCSQKSGSFYIKRGVGSMNIQTALNTSTIDLNMGGRELSLPINITTPVWKYLSGTVSGFTSGKNAQILIESAITIPEGDTLIIEEGSIVAVNEAVDINNFGHVIIQGTKENPIVFTCSKPDAFWGGFLSKGNSNSIEVSNSFFCQSGYHANAGYQWGHAKRQALFYLENSDLKMSHSYMIDHVGQIFYSTSAVLNIEDIFIQRAKTGGQLVKSELDLNNSIFTDFPDDSYVFRDEDNDALYLDYTNARIKNSTFMFTKDDGIDSGGSDGGEVSVDNCWFDSNFHEGLALSSISPATKSHRITNCTVTNCQQGIELGYSSSNHSVYIDNCFLYKNEIGLRYGDNNRSMGFDGTMYITNTRSLNNTSYDVWNMIRPLWKGKLEKMKFTNTTVSKTSEQYPGLPITGNN